MVASLQNSDPELELIDISIQDIINSITLINILHFVPNMI